MRLALAWSLLAVVLGSPDARAGDAGFRVAVDVAESTDDAFRKWRLVGLQRKLVVRLTEEGFSVAGEGQASDATVQLRGDGDGITVVVTADGESRSERPSVDHRRLGYTHLGIIQLAVTMVRSVADQRTGRVQPVVDDGGWVHRIGVAGIAGTRMPAFYGGGELFFYLGEPWGWGIRGAIAASPSWGSGFWVVETAATLAVGWSWTVERWHGLAAVRAGAMLWSYGAELDSGIEVDPVLALHVGAGRAITDRLSVGLWLAPTWTGRSRVVRRGSRELWESEAFRVVAGLSGSWRMGGEP